MQQLGHAHTHTHRVCDVRYGFPRFSVAVHKMAVELAGEQKGKRLAVEDVQTMSAIRNLPARSVVVISNVHECERHLQSIDTTVNFIGSSRKFSDVASYACRTHGACCIVNVCTVRVIVC